jgi:hypothetical protein
LSSHATQTGGNSSLLGSMTSRSASSKSSTQRGKTASTGETARMACVPSTSGSARKPASGGGTERR